MAARRMNQGWDHCIGKLITYSLRGAAVGLFVGIQLFKKKLPPGAYVAGLGAGVSYIDCEKHFETLTLSELQTAKTSEL